MSTEIFRNNLFSVPLASGKYIAYSDVVNRHHGLPVQAVSEAEEAHWQPHQQSDGVRAGMQDIDHLL